MVPVDIPMGESSAKPRLPHFYIPKDIGPFFDSLVLALFKLSKRSSAGEVLKKDPNLKNEEAVSRGLAYLAYIGVVTRKKGGYELEEKGRQIGVALIENRADQVDLLWRGVLQAHKLHSLVEEYITEEGAGVRGSSIGLGEFIRRKAGEKWKSHFVKEGGKRLAKLFQSKGLVGYDEQDDSIKLSVPAGTVTVNIVPSTTVVTNAS